MGRRPDDPAVQAAKGFPGRRRSKTEKAIAEAERLAKLLADAPVDTSGLPFMLADARLAAAQQVWRDYAPQLARNNLLERTDRLMFATFCVYMAEWVAANEEMQRTGMSQRVKSTTGSYKWIDTPAVSRRDTAMKFILELSRRFGLSPLDRYELLKHQAGNPLGGLFNAQPAATTQAPAPEAPPPAEQEVVGSLADYDSPPPGSQVN